MFFIVKIFISALLIAGASELSKRNTFLSALLISLPLVSVLSFAWVYIESKDLQKISQLSTDVLLMIVPSLILFIALPLLIKWGLNFRLCVTLSCLITSGTYAVYVKVLSRFGIIL